MTEVPTDLSARMLDALPSFLEKGPVYLFALFERPDIEGKWDLLISSEESDKDAKGTTRFFANKILPTFDRFARQSLSRLIPVKSSAPALLALTSAVHVDGSTTKISNCNFDGLEVKNAVVFRSVKPQLKIAAS